MQASIVGIMNGGGIVYSQNCQALSESYVATKPDEIKALLEVGFEFVCEKDELLYFRKRK